MAPARWLNGRECRDIYTERMIRIWMENIKKLSRILSKAQKRKVGMIGILILIGGVLETVGVTAIPSADYRDYRSGPYAEKRDGSAGVQVLWI